MTILRTLSTLSLGLVIGCTSTPAETSVSCPVGTFLNAGQCIPNQGVKADGADTYEGDSSSGTDTLTSDASQQEDSSSSGDNITPTDTHTPTDILSPADATSQADAATPIEDAVSNDTMEPSDTSPTPLNPWPVPQLDEEPSEQCQAAKDEKWYFQYLDNLCDEKVWPTDQDRDRACPTNDDSPFMTLQDGSVVEYFPSSAPVKWDTGALDGLLPPGMRVALILIKRVNGVPHYRYISNGTHDVAAQPWSTTKILAAANAAATIRIKSDYKVGLTAKAGAHKIGDLVTSVCNYDNSPFTSNGLGRWFHDVGGRAKGNALIHDAWLKRPATETFGGNYGDQSPAVPYTLKEADGSEVTISPDLSSGFANNLSMHTLAEAVKRLVLHREEPTQRLPGIQWHDIKVLLFGADGSAKYGEWGGMTQDTSIYIEAGHDMQYVEDRSQGQWTIFSKLGLGSQGQFMNVGYACWPSLANDGTPFPGAGREFVISTHLDQGGADWDARDRLLAKAYRKIILRIMDGRL